MRPKAQNEMAGLWPHAAMGPVERMVRPHSTGATAECCELPAMWLLEDVLVRTNMFWKQGLVEGIRNAQCFDFYSFFPEFG